MGGAAVMTKKINLQLDNAKDEEEITVDIDRRNFNQEEIASLMERSINISYLSNENDYIPISKEEVRYIDINKHTLKIKMNTKAKILNEKETNIFIPHNYNSSISPVYSSGSRSAWWGSGSSTGSGVYWYGLDLI